MKKILFIFITVLISISLNATQYYVATTGSDVSGKGTFARPWATLKHAADTLKGAVIGATGDTINMAAGSYTSDTLTLRAKVSVIGAGAYGAYTKITSTYTANDYRTGMIKMGQRGDLEGTNGDQTIAGIWFDGNSTTASRAIGTVARSNINIHHCRFTNFYYSAIVLHGQSIGGQPSIYGANIKIYNCNINNCAQDTYGNIYAQGTEGLQIYNDTITATARAAGDNGYGIKMYSGYNRGTKIHNNLITLQARADASFDIAMEFAYSQGGIEVYENTVIDGNIDMAEATERGIYDYSYYIHDNNIYSTALLNNASFPNWGIVVEEDWSDIIISRNYIKNKYEAISVSNAILNQNGSNIRIDYNIIENCGYSATSNGHGIIVYNAVASNDINGVYIYNNVIDGGTGYSPYRGIYIWLTGTADNIVIKNNIIQNFTYSPIRSAIKSGTPSIGSLTAKNNIYYSNTTSNDPAWILLPTTLDTTSNIYANPVFVGGSPYSYKIQSTSPARDAGIAVGLTEDYANLIVPIGSAPDIGAYEYGNETAPYWTEQGIGWDRLRQKLNFRDSVNFSKGFMISGVPVAASGSGLEILGGLEASVDDLNNTQNSHGNFQGQIDDLISADTSFADKVNIADTLISADPGYYTQRQVDSIAALKAGTVDQSFTGTTVISQLNVGSSTSNTKAEIDSMAFVGTQIADYVAGDTTTRYVKLADRIEGVALADSLVYPEGYATRNQLKGTLTPRTTGASDLGSTSLPYGNVFVKSTGTINFDNGDVVATHSANTLAITGGRLSVSATSAGSSAINGTNTSTTTGTVGVYGKAASTSGAGTYYGVWGEASGVNASGTNVGVYGLAANSGTNYAVFSDGMMYVNGRLKYRRAYTGNLVATDSIPVSKYYPCLLYTGDSAIDIDNDPQLADGTAGEIMIIMGTSNTNTLTLDDGTGLRLAGGASIVLGEGDVIVLMYIDTSPIADWVEISRSDN